jgi:hypothetical protein
LTLLLLSHGWVVAAAATFLSLRLGVVVGIKEASTEETKSICWLVE